LHKTSKRITNNVSIEQQRERFQIVSDNMITLLRNFSTIEKSLTIQFCPMADDNNGTYWVSDAKEIRNPYFGDAMLTCGSVVEELN
jgi:Cu(I)/Ag(I) efflux system membrane fusion protein